MVFKNKYYERVFLNLYADFKTILSIGKKYSVILRNLYK